MRGCLRKGGGHLKIRFPVDRGRGAEALLEEMVEVAAVVITCPQRHFPDGEGAVLQQRRGGLQTNIPQIPLRDLGGAFHGHIILGNQVLQNDRQQGPEKIRADTAGKSGGNDCGKYRALDGGEQ